MQGEDSGSLSKKIAELLRNSGIDLFSIFGEHTVFVIRKTAHMTEYAILFFLLLLPLRFAKNGRWIALGTAVLFAATDEIHQAFIPGRVATIVDVGFDSCGAALALLCSIVFSSIRNLLRKG